MSREGSSDHTPASSRNVTEHYFHWFISALFHVCVSLWLSLLARGDLMICRSKRCPAENWVTFKWKVKFAWRVVSLQVGFKWDLTGGNTVERSLHMKTAERCRDNAYSHFSEHLSQFWYFKTVSHATLQWMKSCRSKLVPQGATNFRNMMSTKKKMCSLIWFIGHSSLLATLFNLKQLSLEICNLGLPEKIFAVSLLFRLDLKDTYS